MDEGGEKNMRLFKKKKERKLASLREVRNQKSDIIEDLQRALGNELDFNWFRLAYQDCLITMPISDKGTAIGIKITVLQK